MEIGFLSPSKLEAARLCEARLAGRLNQLGEEEWNEEHGEGAAMGTLAHEGAKHWYRPCESWLKRVRSGEDPEKLAAEARKMLDGVYAQFPPVEGEDEKAKETRLALLREAQDQLEDQFLVLGLLKHPVTNPNHAFRMAIDACAQGRFGNELPKDAASVQESRGLFDEIIAHYNRDNLNIVFAERRYKGTIGNGVPIHLIVDLGVDRGNGRLEIVDYKTGWITISTEDMYSKDQVLMNLLAATRYDETLSYYPHKSFTYYWVRPGFETGPISFTADRLADYEHYLAVQYQHMLNINVAQEVAGAKLPHESINGFCNSCPRKNQCGTFQRHVGEAMMLARAATPEELEAFVDEDAMLQYLRYGSQIKILEASKKALALILKGRVEKTEKREIIGQKAKARIRQDRMDTPDPSVIIQLAQTMGIDLATLANFTKDRIEKAFGQNVEATRRIQMTMRRGSKAPFVSVLEIGKKQNAKEVEAADAVPSAA